MLKLDEIKSLIPTHNRLRDPKSTKFFQNFLEQGQIFRCHKKPIALIRFEDGHLYIRDGHRRLSSAVLVKADLLDVEYKIEDSTYERYMESHYNIGWFTPFDPRSHCRLPDFFDFKDEAEFLHRRAMNEVDFLLPPSFTELDKFIKDNFHRYCEPREVHTLGELVRKTFK